MSRVFLSHSHIDRPFARQLAADLRRAGHDVWLDEAQIEVGDSLIEKIREGLNEVDYVAAIISRASVASPWVTKELDIASNREIRESRIVVLPVLLERVPLPGFLEGKFYADFTDTTKYKESLKLVLRRLGPAVAPPTVPAEELAKLRKELARAKRLADERDRALRAHQNIALRGKSKGLVAAIEKANREFPQHAPINTTYAFEVDGYPITLDYLLWVIDKVERRGSHPLEFLIEMDNKWGEVRSMLEAYSDLLEADTR